MFPHRSMIAALAALTSVLWGCAQAVAPSPLPPRNPLVPPPVAAPSRTSFLSRSGAQLTLNGQQYRVVSVDAYELATDWGTNYGCGGMLNEADLDAFFARLPQNATVRIWGFQGSMATNPETGARDWSGLDRVVAAAQRHGQHLIVSLGNQSGDCDDGHWKDRAWYQGGFRAVYPGDGRTVASVSYWDWVQQIVTRYRDSNVVAIWELINEPQASECAAGAMSGCYGHLQCPNEGSAAAALRSFVDVVGAKIKRIDPNHLVESGSLGGDQCGWAGTDYAMVHGSPGIDVASYHDYALDQVVPGDLGERIGEATGLTKPIIVGELGVRAGQGLPGCPSLIDRRNLIQAKVAAMLSAGAASVFLWDWVPDPDASTCTLDVGTADPLMTLLGPQ